MQNNIYERSFRIPQGGTKTTWRVHIRTNERRAGLHGVRTPTKYERIIIIQAVLQKTLCCYSVTTIVTMSVVWAVGPYYRHHRSLKRPQGGTYTTWGVLFSGRETMDDRVSPVSYKKIV